MGFAVKRKIAHIHCLQESRIEVQNSPKSVPASGTNSVPESDDLSVLIDTCYSLNKINRRAKIKHFVIAMNVDKSDSALSKCIAEPS
jgi:hypothetical protein